MVKRELSRLWCELVLKLLAWSQRIIWMWLTQQREPFCAWHNFKVRLMGFSPLAFGTFGLVCNMYSGCVQNIHSFLFSSESHCATRSFSVRSSQVLVGLCQIPTNINSPEKGTIFSWGKPLKGVFIEMLVRSLASKLLSKSLLFFSPDKLAFLRKFWLVFLEGGYFIQRLWEFWVWPSTLRMV